MSTDTTLIDQTLVDVPAHPSSEAIGDAIEHFACDHFDLVHGPNCHYDARGRDDTPVQIKAATWRMKNGHYPTGPRRYAHGRFRLYESDHAWLLENNGLYAFVVYERHRLGLIPLYAKLVPPEFVETDLLPDDGWYDNGDDGVPRKAEGDDCRIAWPDVFPRAEGTL